MQNFHFGKTLGLFCLLFFFQKNEVAAQTDTQQTLQWVENQGDRIDTLLYNAMLSHDHVNLIFKLMDAYLIFDAIALTGVYCPEVREAAQLGRVQTDVLNYHLEKDRNSIVVRAARARVEAEKMKTAARNCQNAGLSKPEKNFSPADVLRQDAQIVLLDLTDGFAAGDFHILSQKIEHAIRVLHDIRHLADTFQDCAAAVEIAEKTISHCEAALIARNWTEVNSAIEAALKKARTLASLDCN